MTTAQQVESLELLFDQDETAWLETMAELLAQGRLAELDHVHLQEYLADMAKRDRREVFSRLVVLMSHLLKWDHQPANRSGSWRGTIRSQRLELRQLVESGTLRKHALDVFVDSYTEARFQAADETEMPIETFALECPWSFEELLGEE